MSTTATQYLNAARAELNYREGANNYNKYGAWYGLNYNPYCAIGLTYVAYEVGAQSLIGGKWAYCPSWGNWWRARKQWYTTPKRGDIVFYDWSGKKRFGFEQHVGVVESFTANSVTAIEFNTTSGSGDQSDGGGVYRRTRSNLYIVGFGRPAWTPETNVVVLPAVHPISHSILVVDGVWGARTTMRVQSMLGIRVNGQMDVSTYRALAAWLRQPLSNGWTTKMKTALQYRVGVDQDGEIGPVTVKAFQRYLNRI